MSGWRRYELRIETRKPSRIGTAERQVFDDGCVYIEIKSSEGFPFRVGGDAPMSSQVQHIDHMLSMLRAELLRERPQ